MLMKDASCKLHIKQHEILLCFQENNFKYKQCPTTKFSIQISQIQPTVPKSYFDLKIYYYSLL